MTNHPATMADAVEALGPGPWWAACDRPESPSDGWTVWDWTCDACVIQLAAEVHRLGRSPATTHVYDAPPVESDIVDVLRDCMAWRAENGLRTLTMKEEP